MCFFVKIKFFGHGKLRSRVYRLNYDDIDAS